MHHGHHHGHGALRLARPGTRVRLAAVCGAAGVAVAAAGVGMYRHQHQPLTAGPKLPQVRLPRSVAEVIAGAIGEIVQVAALYPLDTVKVRCQAHGVTAQRAVADLLRAHGGSPFAPGLWRQLYAGAVGASLLSVAVGALYYSSFCGAQRRLLAWAAALERGEQQHEQPQQQQQQQQPKQRKRHQRPHGPSVDYHHDAALAVVCSADAAAKRAKSGQSAAAEPLLDGSAATSAASAAATAAAAAEVSPANRARANMGAAVVAALVGAVVEAPVELFKHRLQAGHATGGVLGQLVGALRAGGPGALFVSMLPFCAKSLPFDTVELATYAGIRDATPRAAAEHPCADVAAGALAGALAVLVSMPADTVKTVIETGGGAAAAGGASGGGGAFAGARTFLATGRNLVARGGPGALFTGVTMRLAEQVPSTALYWLAVEGVKRALEPYVIADEGSSGSGSGSGTDGSNSE